MNEIVIHASSHDYCISVGSGLRFQLNQYMNKDYSSVLIVTDDQVAELYLEDIKSNFNESHVTTATIPSGEKSKHIDYFYRLQTDAIKAGLDRNSLIIALGGGVVGDLAGFVAATFMRGIDYMQMPTTILAHDSSVGGKVAINHELGKNLIGNFYSPTAVVYDVETLHSLSAKETRSGYAELVKEALISSVNFYENVLKRNVMDLSKEELEQDLLQGMKVKAQIVQNDEKESGERKFLNLGHTLAHAIEATLDYGKLTHGEAVAIGLLFATHVSESVYQTGLPFDTLFSWLKKNSFPLDVSFLNSEEILQKMKSDKKATNQTVQMVLLKQIGEPAIENMDDAQIINYIQTFKQRMV